MNNYRNSVIFGWLLILFFSCKNEIAIKPQIPDVGTITESNLKKSKFALSVPLISNLNSATTHIYELANFAVNVNYYTDRNYKITSLPAYISDIMFVRTACADKGNKSNSGVAFTLDKDATIYVGYDSRAVTIPAWLSTWKKLPEKIGVSDAAGYLNLYSKQFAAGAVNIGGNMAAPASGAQCQYVIAVKANTLFLGANGHSLGLPAYTATTMTQQIAMLRKMGMRGYRQNVPLDNDGTISSLDGFSKLYKAATDSGIIILPMIAAQTLDFNKTETQLAKVGKLFGVNLALKNSKYFNYYELGNELDNLIILPGTDGNQLANYDAAKFKKVAAYLKGWDLGIKSIQPTAQTMVNAGWLHYKFLQMLQDYGVGFDIVAYHWYSDMEGGAKNKNIPDITLKLSGLFSKPIWFTEVGQRYKNVGNLEQLQSDFTLNFIAKCQANPQVQAVLFYELFDEPDRSDAEGHFGLVKWTQPYLAWEYKQVAKNIFLY